jgi:hypothetical protein
MSGLLDFLKNMGQGFVEARNPAIAQANIERQRAAELMRERLFNENMATQRFQRDQDLDAREQQHWDANNQLRQQEAQRQADQDALNLKEKTFQEQLGLGNMVNSGQARDLFPATALGLAPQQPDQASTPNPDLNSDLSARTPGVPPMQIPAEPAGPGDITGPLTGRTVVPLSPMEQRQKQLQDFAGLGKSQSDWLANNQDQINQFMFTGGKFFPQDKTTDPIKDALTAAYNETDPEKRKVLLQQATDLATAKNAKPKKVGELDPSVTDENNYYNSGLSKATIDANAARYNMTGGEMPALGMSGNPAARVAILQRAHELEPTVDLGANKVAYQAGSGSLKKMLSGYDQLMNFENTGKANLEQAARLISQIPDTGSPWLNRPIRDINANLLGNKEQAAFNAAREVAANEIAQVVNNRGMSSVLTDKARDEVRKFIPDNATPEQILGKSPKDINSVINILKTDMDNRKQYYEGQITGAYSRMKAGASGLANVGDYTPEVSSEGPKFKKPVQPTTSTTPPTAIPTPPSLPRPAKQGDKLSKADALSFYNAFGKDAKKAEQAAQSLGWDTSK